MLALVTLLFVLALAFVMEAWDANGIEGVHQRDQSPPRINMSSRAAERTLISEDATCGVASHASRRALLEHRRHGANGGE